MKRFLLLLSVLTLLTPYVVGQNALPSFIPKIQGALTLRALAVQDDGKILIGSSELHTVDNKIVDGLVRLNPDGTLDESFQLQVSISDRGDFSKIIAQEDGKILVAGSRIFEDYQDKGIMRFNSDGSIDEAFQTEKDFNNVVDVVHQDDGKYVLVSADLYPSPICRLNPDGSFDDSFQTISGPNAYGGDKFEILIQPDDQKILMVGSFSEFDGREVNGIVRLNTDGTIDNSFQTGSGFANDAGFTLATGAALQKDNKIVVVGDFSSYNDTTTKNIICLNPDGTVDESFVIPGPTANTLDYIIEVTVTNDSKIVVTSYNKILQLNSDGSLDTSFQQGELNFNQSVTYNPRIFPFGQKLIVIGSFTNYNFSKRVGLAILDSQGNVSSVDPKLGGIPEINAVALQQDGKIIIGGEFIAVEGHPAFNLARLNSDGSPDLAFLSNLGSGPDRAIKDIFIEEDGNILIGGGFTEFNGDANHKALVRLSANGVLDKTYKFSTYYLLTGSGVNKIIPQSDTHLLIGGSFETLINGTKIDNLVRISRTDGSIDTNFNTGNNFSAPLPHDIEIFTIAFQSNGKILIGGNNTNYQNGGGIFHRLDMNGNIDPSFTSPDVSNTSVKTIHVLKNDEIMMGGFFSQLIPQYEPSPIFQLTKDGATVDQVSLGNLRGELSAITPLQESEFLLTGAFEGINAMPHQSIAITSLGGDVKEYNPYFNPYSTINDILPIGTDSLYLVAGRFTTLNQMRNYSGLAIITLKNNIPTITGVDVDTIEEDSQMALTLEQIAVDDFDNYFPSDFTLTVHNGENYTYENHQIIPAPNFYGTLTIPMVVSDGTDSSELYNHKLEVISVNDAPVIKGTKDALMVIPDSSLALTTEMIVIEDPDNGLEDLTLIIHSSENYTVQNSIVTPHAGFTGTLFIPVSASDGFIEGPISEIKVEVSWLASAQEEEIAKELKIYPNPVQDLVNIQFENSIKDPVSVLVYDLTGKRMLKQQLQKENSTFVTTIDLSSLQAGSYILKIIQGSNTSSRRIAIAR